MRLCDLRDDGTDRAGAKAAAPKLLPRGPLIFANDDLSPSEELSRSDIPRVNDVALLRREIDDLKSELAALRLQYEINEEEKKTLVKENDELQQKLSLASMTTTNRGSDGASSITAIDDAGAAAAVAATQTSDFTVV